MSDTDVINHSEPVTGRRRLGDRTAIPGSLAGTQEEPVAWNDFSRHSRIVSQLRLLWECKRFIGNIVLVSTVAFAATAFLIPSRYESTVRLMPPDNQSSPLMMLAAISGKGSGASNLGGLATDLLDIKTSGSLFVGIMQSRSVQDALVNKFDLRRVYWVRMWRDARKKLSKNTSFTEDRKSGIISVTVTDRSPQRAAAMAEEYVTELASVVNQLSTSSAHKERVFLEGRLQQVKQDLEDAEKEFSAFASKNAALDIKEQGKAMVNAAATLQGELIATQSELAGLKQIYSDDNARVRSVQARVDELRRQLGNLGGKEGSETRNSDDGSVYPSIRRLPILGVTYADLYRRTAIQEAVFETLTREYELAKVQEAREIPGVKVLDPAEVPERKSFPPRVLLVGLGILFGFAAGITAVLLRDHWQANGSQDPLKALIAEAYSATKSHIRLRKRLIISE